MASNSIEMSKSRIPIDSMRQ